MTIYDTAEIAYNAFVKGWRPTPGEFKSELGITDHQFPTLKKHVRAMMMERSSKPIPWGYSDLRNRYLVARNDIEGAEIERYSLTHSRNGVQITMDLAEANAAHGFISKRDADEIGKVGKAYVNNTDDILRLFPWRKRP